MSTASTAAFNRRPGQLLCPQCELYKVLSPTDVESQTIGILWAPVCKVMRAHYRAAALKRRPRQQPIDGGYRHHSDAAAAAQQLGMATALSCARKPSHPATPCAAYSRRSAA